MYTSSIFDLLSNDERIIVYSSQEDGVLYTWNQSCTLQCWKEYSGCEDSWWEEIDIRTLESQPKDYHAARKKAQLWHVGQ